MIRDNERLLPENHSVNRSRNLSVQSKDNHSTTVESHVSTRKAKSKANSFTHNQRDIGPFLPKQNGKLNQNKKDSSNNENERDDQAGCLIKKLSLTPQLHKKQETICINDVASLIITVDYRMKELSKQKQPIDNKSSINLRLAINDLRSGFISKLIQCELLHPFNARPFYNSLIIFDWDDTLFPTSNLLNRKDFNEDLSGNERLTKKIKNLQVNVISILTSSINRGNTFIITNAVPGWVELNAKRFFPSVVPLFSQIKIISAREEFERYYPCNPRMWKIKSFLNILRYYDCHRITNILCIGDSEFEMDAGKKMASHFKHVCIKRIRFKNNPSFHEVTNQIYSVINQFGFIHSSVKSGVYHANIREKTKKPHSRKSSKKSVH